MLNHPSQSSDDAQDEKQGDFPVIEEEKTQAVTLKDSYVSDDVANSTERYNLSPSPEDEDFEAPTEEEMQTLRHVGGKIPMR
ncbi:CDG_1a_G0034390.mRNA.1.CDS.1 [Saccharomyces cerevisiae]|nr:CDG_1a_G0034390.mRNA.1.CDS.1 [Saccharomyces cerevisiae]CAI7396779.1 CDG_1a_G0034390.mRNA.1.CDS.1 [Saccharomyces cerevisiae]